MGPTLARNIHNPNPSILPAAARTCAASLQEQQKKSPDHFTVAQDASTPNLRVTRCFDRFDHMIFCFHFLLAPSPVHSTNCVCPLPHGLTSNNGAFAAREERCGPVAAIDVVAFQNRRLNWSPHLQVHQAASYQAQVQKFGCPGARPSHDRRPHRH